MRLLTSGEGVILWCTTVQFLILVGFLTEHTVYTRIYSFYCRFVFFHCFRLLNCCAFFKVRSGSNCSFSIGKRLVTQL